MQYIHSKVLVRKDGTSGEQGTYLGTSGAIVKHICCVNSRITQSSRQQHFGSEHKKVL